MQIKELRVLLNRWMPDELGQLVFSYLAEGRAEVEYLWIINNTIRLTIKGRGTLYKISNKRCLSTSLDKRLWYLSYNVTSLSYYKRPPRSVMLPLTDQPKMAIIRRDPVEDQGESGGPVAVASANAERSRGDQATITLDVDPGLLEDVSPTRELRFTLLWDDLGHIDAFLYSVEELWKDGRRSLLPYI